VAETSDVRQNASRRARLERERLEMMLTHSRVQEYQVALDLVLGAEPGQFPPPSSEEFLDLLKIVRSILQQRRLCELKSPANRHGSYQVRPVGKRKAWDGEKL
jgi:hypothetical protein